MLTNDDLLLLFIGCSHPHVSQSQLSAPGPADACSISSTCIQTPLHGGDDHAEMMSMGAPYVWEES